MVEKISMYLAKGCEWLVGILMAIMTIVVIIGVFFAMFWGMLYRGPRKWLDMLGSGCAFWLPVFWSWEDGHIGISVLRDKLSPTGKRLFFVIADMASILFLLMWGYISIESYHIVKYDISPGVNIALGWVFVSQPICALLMLIQAVLLLVRRLTGQTSLSVQDKVDV